MSLQDVDMSGKAEVASARCKSHPLTLVRHLTVIELSKFWQVCTEQLWEPGGGVHQLVLQQNERDWGDACLLSCKQQLAHVRLVKE